MPKKTFINLNSEKKQKIEQAIEKEFSQTSFEKASISNIVEYAQIPRGSFYQYFEDKEDAIKYILQKYMKREKEIMKEFLLKNRGDIFETSIDIYEYLTNKSKEEDKLNLYKNVLDELKKNNINIFQEEKECKIDDSINIEMLDIKNQDDIKYIMRIISTITRTISIEVISKKMTKEKGKDILKNELEILKRGMLKKESK